MGGSWTQLSLASLRNNTADQGVINHQKRLVALQCMNLYMLLEWTDTNMVGMFSKWWNLNSALGYHATPPPPIFLLFSTWFLPLPFNFALFLPPDSVLGVPSILCFSCRDLFWPGSSGLALHVGLFRVTHPLAWFPPLTHSGPMCSSQFNPLGLLSLALRPSPTWAALHPAAALDVPFSSQFSIPATFLFRTPGDPTFPPFPPTQHVGWGRTDFEGVGDKFGGGGKVSWLCMVPMSRRGLFREWATLAKAMRSWWLWFQEKDSCGDERVRWGEASGAEYKN